ncbi:PilZ domain-containing protein [Paludibaculum fermentans]|uniref:PilZ domain-containing protein n=1 Tax=Paludibaculum fermentans TaxID=1473598 RepID=UPI003EB98A5A
MNFIGSEPIIPGKRGKTDRRASDRFPIERELRFKLISKRLGDEAGAGVTVNLSSGGVLFQTEKPLIPGKRLEMAISWPAQLDNKCALKLVARGRIVRCEKGMAAVEIQQYEFRTVGVHGLAI